MASKRVALKDRRAQDARGVDALIQPSEAASEVVSQAPKLAKVTLYVRPDQVEAIEEIQLAERKRTGKRPDKSDLIQEALDLLIQKHSKHLEQ